MNEVYIKPESSYDELELRFTYHPPIGNQLKRYEEIRRHGLDFANRLNELCPTSRELAIALTNLEQVIMWANAAIARNEKESLDAK